MAGLLVGFANWIKMNLRYIRIMCVSAQTFFHSTAISCELPFEITFRHPGSGQQPSS